MKTILITSLLALGTWNVQGQTYDLPKSIENKKLLPSGRATISASAEPSKRAIWANGIVWLQDETFSEGTIEVDIRGNDVLQGTFAGILFHAVDTTVYDVIYFRPFNFQAADPVRRIHAVQYMSMPEYPWVVTREKMNGIYEKAVTPAPGPNDWFHATIVVKGKTISVFVDGSGTPSITIEKLNDRTTGRIGFWCMGRKPAEFANLVIRKS